MTLAVALVAVALAAPALRAEEARREQLTAILGARPVEIQLLEAQLQGKQSQQLLGVTVYTGTLKGRKVVLAASGVGNLRGHKFVVGKDDEKHLGGGGAS